MANVNIVANAHNKPESQRRPAQAVALDPQIGVSGQQPSITFLSGAAARERLRTGNRYLDDIITRVTGKALAHQEPAFKFDGATLWLISLTTLCVLLGSLIALLSTWSSVQPVLAWPVAVVLVLALTGRFRMQQVIFAHYSVHKTVSRRWPMIGDWIGEIATALVFAQNLDEYRRDHVKLHHRFKTFTTKEDPDAAFLDLLGFKPGMSDRELYARLLLTMVSPQFHWLFVVARVRSALWTASWRHRALVMAWIAVLTWLATVLPAWTFMVAIVLPLGPVYHVSALLQFLTEHRWRVTPDGPRDAKEYAERCVGRFCLVPVPAPGLPTIVSVTAWSGWVARMLPVMLFRLSVWVGDLPVHDNHHVAGPLRQSPHDWMHGYFLRQQAIDAGDELGLSLRETYTVTGALDWVFDGLATAEDPSARRG